MPRPGVLIIDDEPAVRDALEDDLRCEGFDLSFAENGEQGLSKVSEIAPAVIILDLRMPVMDGLEFLSQIDLKPSDPYSVIVLTGHGDEYDLRACYDAGVRTFLKKPFNIFEERGVVKNAVALQEFTNRLDELVKERTAKLEQQMREMTLVNNLIQRQLGERSGITVQYRELLQQLQELVAGLDEVAARLRALPPPDPMDFS